MITLLILIPFIMLQFWKNRPINLLKAKRLQSKDEAIKEYHRRNKVSVKIIILLLLIATVLSLRNWHLYEHSNSQYLDHGSCKIQNLLKH